MYMGPIVAADTATAPADVPTARKAQRPPSGALPRFVAGVPTLALAAVVMVPWLAGSALLAGVAIGVRALPGAPRAILSAIDYAGSIALGR
jgi:hypothetical protein